jgi:hypothetical protein
MRRRLYRYRYLLLGSSVVAILSLILNGYATRSRTIDLASGSVADWPYYGRDPQGSRYTPLDQINEDTVVFGFRDAERFAAEGSQPLPLPNRHTAIRPAHPPACLGTRQPAASCTSRGKQTAPRNDR